MVPAGAGVLRVPLFTHTLPGPVAHTGVTDGVGDGEGVNDGVCVGDLELEHADAPRRRAEEHAEDEQPLHTQVPVEAEPHQPHSFAVEQVPQSVKLEQDAGHDDDGPAQDE